MIVSNSSPLVQLRSTTDRPIACLVARQTRAFQHRLVCLKDRRIDQRSEVAVKFNSAQVLTIGLGTVVSQRE